MATTYRINQEMKHLYLKKEKLKEQLYYFFFKTRGSLHHESMLRKRSNLMQQCADIYLLQSHSTCFGRHSAHHQED